MKRINRILKIDEFQEIIRVAPFIKTQQYIIHHRPNDGAMRIGIRVSKKNNGNAVTRNKIKRQIRAIIAKNIDLTISEDVIIVVRQSYATDAFAENESALTKAFEQIGDQH